MSLDIYDTDTNKTARSYRYYFQHGTVESPTEGESRGFDEEWQALQYMDENREHAQAAANESGEMGCIQVVDMDSFGKDRIVAIETLPPIFVSERPKYVSTRAKLTDLMADAVRMIKKVGGK